MKLELTIIADNLTEAQKKKVDELKDRFMKELEDEKAGELEEWVFNPNQTEDKLANLRHMKLYIADKYAHNCGLQRRAHLVIADGAGKFESREIDGHFFIIQKP